MDLLPLVSLDGAAVKKGKKQKLYADRRDWEVSDRPWRPSLLPVMMSGSRQSGLSMEFKGLPAAVLAWPQPRSSTKICWQRCLSGYSLAQWTQSRPGLVDCLEPPWHHIFFSKGLSVPVWPQHCARGRQHKDTNHIACSDMLIVPWTLDLR